MTGQVFLSPVGENTGFTVIDQLTIIRKWKKIFVSLPLLLVDSLRVPEVPDYVAQKKKYTMTCSFSVTVMHNNGEKWNTF